MHRTLRHGLAVLTVLIFFNFANLAESGPLVYEYPAGQTAGIIMDISLLEGLVPFLTATRAS